MTNTRYNIRPKYRSPLIPNPMQSESQWLRFNHLDLEIMDNGELWSELRFIEARLWELPEDHWLRERASQIREEIKARKSRTTVIGWGKRNETG